MDARATTRQRLAAALADLLGDGTVFAQAEIHRTPPSTFRAYKSGGCCHWHAWGRDAAGRVTVTVEGHGTMAECVRRGMTLEVHAHTGQTHAYAN